MSMSFIFTPLIYLTGNLRDASGVFAYYLVDFLYRPILSASLVFVIFVIRELIGENASRRMDLTLIPGA